MNGKHPFRSDTWREYLDKRLGEDKVECAKCGRWVAPRHLDASAHCQECAEQVDRNRHAERERHDLEP